MARSRVGALDGFQQKIDSEGTLSRLAHDERVDLDRGEAPRGYVSEMRKRNDGADRCLLVEGSFSARSGDQGGGLGFRQHLGGGVRIDRSDPQAGFLHHLDERPTEAHDHDRAELRVVADADEELHPFLQHGLNDDRGIAAFSVPSENGTQLCVGRAHGRGIGKAELDEAVLGLVRKARGDALEHDGKAETFRDPRRLVGVRRVRRFDEGHAGLRDEQDAIELAELVERRQRKIMGRRCGPWRGKPQPMRHRREGGPHAEKIGDAVRFDRLADGPIHVAGRGIVEEYDLLFMCRRRLDADFRHVERDMGVRPVSARRVECERDDAGRRLARERLENLLEAARVPAESPGIDRVARPRELREGGFHRGERRGRKLREAEPDVSTDVRHESGLSARDGDHDGTARLGRCRVFREQDRRLDHLVDVACANDAMATEECIIDRILAGKRARMRGDGRPATLGPSDLERDDPLAAPRRLGRRFGEAARVADRLEEQHDHADPMVRDDGAEIVGGRAHGLVAGGDDIGKPDLARVLADRDGDRAAVRDEGGRTCVEARQRSGRPHANPIMDIDEAHVVGSANGHIIEPRRLEETPLQGLAARAAAVRKSAGIHDRGTNAATARFLDGRDRVLGGDGDEDRVGRRRQLAERSIAALSLDLAVTRVDHVDIPAEAELPEVVDDPHRRDAFSR